MVIVSKDSMSRVALVRYGAIPEVARCRVADDGAFARGDTVVVRTHRGVQLGTYLEAIASVALNGGGDETAPEAEILRPPSGDDIDRHQRHRTDCEAAFDSWRGHIARWNLQLELIDLERTLDAEKLILYVLNDRGPESTKLALQAAAAGLGIVEVQPVGIEGLVPAQSGGGCGSGGCGSGQCAS